MKVQVKLLGALRHHATADAAGTLHLDLPEASPVQDVIGRLPVPANASYIVVVNGDRIAPVDLPLRVLKDGDTVSLVPAIKGG